MQLHHSIRYRKQAKQSGATFKQGGCRSAKTIDAT
jgi:hypothetical protein